MLHEDSYTYANKSHRLLAIDRITDSQPNGVRDFTYDAAGNRIAGTAEDSSEQAYAYNHANRMSGASVDTSPVASYTYNPLGQRIIKTLPNNTKEIYHYDENGLLIAVTNESNATLREYVYLDGQAIAFITNGQIHYIHNDHLGTPQVATDQNQQVVWMGDYQPFGKLAVNQGNSVELYSRFPGQYFDEETGLYYNYFRDYDPSIGRYIQSDPIGLEGGINTYGYVEGNPLIYSDPLGLLVCYQTTNRHGGGQIEICRPNKPGEPSRPSRWTGWNTGEYAAKLPHYTPPNTKAIEEIDCSLCNLNCFMVTTMFLPGPILPMSKKELAEYAGSNAASFGICHMACKEKCDKKDKCYSGKSLITGF